MSENSASAAPRPRRRRQFSVASVLLVTALLAVVLAAVRTAVVLDKPDWEWVGSAGAGGLVMGAIIGAALGAAQPSPVRGLLLGLMVGMASGTAAGIMVALPRALPVVVLGAPVLIVFAAVVRKLSGRR